MTNLRSIYVELLKFIFNDGISIRTEKLGWKISSPMYCPKGINGRQNNPVILLSRTSGGQWFDVGSTGEKLNSLMDGADNLQEELILLSHEYGHHFSRFQDYERVKAAYDNDPKAVSENERQLLYDEEIFAWEQGLRILKSLHYLGEQIFDQIRTRCLDSYRNGLGLITGKEEEG